jgi:hypothetical protein
MARVFSICFKHKGKSYSALVSVKGKDDPSIRVIANHDSIEIHLPTGRLIFSIADVLHRLFASSEKSTSNAVLYITQNISLQLLSSEK